MPSPKDPKKREVWIEKQRLSHLGKFSSKKGKTYEELYGEVRGEEIKEKNRVAQLRPKAKARKSAATKRQWADPEVRARRLFGMGVANKKSEVKVRRSIACKKRSVDSEYLIRLSIAAKEAGNRPEVKAKRSGNNSPTKRSEVRKKISESHIGSKNPSWRGGISNKPYLFDFNEELKESIRERDNYTCQLCGKTNEECLEKWNRRLDIHHIDYNKKNSQDYNLISLCHPCHQKTNFNRTYWKKVLAEMNCVWLDI